jgi:hypothetical protein
VDPGLLRWTSGSDVGRHGEHLIALLAVHPGDAVVGHVELTLLLKINRRRDHCRNGDNHQQSIHELLP